jgi:hypothetical protein
LSDDRPGVQPFVHEMHGHAGHLGPVAHGVANQPDGSAVPKNSVPIVGVSITSPSFVCAM